MFQQILNYGYLHLTFELFHENSNRSRLRSIDERRQSTALSISRNNNRPKSGVGNLRPAWTFDMARIRNFVTHVRVQNRVKTKLHDKQVLR